MVKLFSQKCTGSKNIAILALKHAVLVKQFCDVVEVCKDGLANSDVAHFLRNISKAVF